MRILFPIYSFYPHQGGGPSLSVYWLAKSLVKEGSEVTVITSTNGLNGKYPFNRWNTIDGISVQYCSNKLRIIRLSLQHIKNVDLIQLSSFCYLPSVILALFVCFFTSKPIIWSPRGELAEEAIKGSKAKKWLFTLYGKLFCKRVVFHGTSEKEIEEISKYFPEAKTVLLPNYIELSPRRYNKIEDYLVYLGRISPIKALDRLVTALSLSKSFMDSDFVIKVAGKAVTSEEVDFEKNLRSLIKHLKMDNKIQFLGEVKGIDKDELLSRAYCSFLVSKTENFGNVVVEAMAQGTPVITSLGTPWSILKDKEVGYHVSNEPISLARSIDDILNLSVNEYERLRERVFAFCSKEYSIVDNVHKWEELYSHLI